MPKRQSLIAIGVALVLGLFAVYIANIFLTNSEERAKVVEVGTARVAVAAVPLDYGIPVTPEKIRFVNYPANAVPPGAFSSINDIIPGGKARIALRPMLMNEPILSSKLTGPGEGASIAALLPDGMRAAAVRVNDVSGVGGFVQPNDSVDVLITRAMTGSDQQVTDVLLQNVRIIAMDQNSKNADGTPVVAKTATIEVTPIDSQKLALAQQIGQLSLVLRKPGIEQAGGSMPTVSLRDLRYGLYGTVRPIGTQAPVVRATVRRAAPVRNVRPAAPQPVRGSVEVVRGTTGSNYEVGDYGS